MNNATRTTIAPGKACTPVVSDRPTRTGIDKRYARPQPMNKSALRPSNQRSLSGDVARGDELAILAFRPLTQTGIRNEAYHEARDDTVGTFSQQSIADPGLNSLALVPLLSDGALGVLGLFLFVAGVVVLYVASRASRQRQPS